MTATPEERLERMNSHVSTWTSPERDELIRRAVAIAHRRMKR